MAFNKKSTKTFSKHIQMLHTYHAEKRIKYMRFVEPNNFATGAMLPHLALFFLQIKSFSLPSKSCFLSIITMNASYE